MTPLEETLAKVMPEETKHWIEVAARYREALEGILQTAPWPDEEGHERCIMVAREALDAFG